MILRSKMPIGNFINCYLYSDKELSKGDQMKYLHLIRNHLNAYIVSLKKPNYLISLDLQLFPDSENENFYKLIANLTAIPTLKFNVEGFDFDNGLTFTGDGDANSGSAGHPIVPHGPGGLVTGGGYAAAGSPGVPVIPVGPKGRIVDTPFLPIFNTFNEGFQIGSVR